MQCIRPHGPVVSCGGLLMMSLKGYAGRWNLQLDSHTSPDADVILCSGKFRAVRGQSICGEGRTCVKLVALQRWAT